MLSGTSCRSRSFSCGMTTVPIPPRRAASSFSFNPPIGSTSPRKRDLTRHGHISPHGNFRETAHQSGTHRNTGAGAIFGCRALGDMNMHVLRVVMVRAGIPRVWDLALTTVLAA